MSLMVSVDVKQHWTMLWHWSEFVPNMSTDIRGHEALLHQTLSLICPGERSGIWWGEWYRGGEAAEDIHPQTAHPQTAHRWARGTRHVSHRQKVSLMYFGETTLIHYFTFAALEDWVCCKQDVPLVECMYLVFTCMPGESYHEWLRSRLCLCDIFRTLTNFLACWFCCKHFFFGPESFHQCVSQEVGWLLDTF